MSFKELKPTEKLTDIENRILGFWEKNQIFEKLVRKNRGKEKWSFLDGPITANNPMGVHHAWGRTYKDYFQRYKAMRGFKERYQSGFDCQGLWVEVEVEKELGFKTKKDIENYGIEKFVAKCKERALKYSKIQIKQSKRLGQWMDWENSYYTMSDENNYAIWHFLKKCHERGLIYKGRDSVPWCPRCGTAISQHEILTEEYKKIEHLAVYFKLKVTGEKYRNTFFLVWTTTPWTIPANVALAIHPEFKYGLYQGKKEKLIILKGLAKKVLGESYRLEKEITGKDLLGLKYQGPFDKMDKIQKGFQENPETFHRVISGKNLVTSEEGTGIIHIAPGAGAEDFKLSKVNNLPVVEVIDEGAVYLEGLGEFSGQNAKKTPEIIIDYLKNFDKGVFFLKEENYSHRYPTCWRCKTELVWRVVDEWYIKMDELREPMMAVTRKIKWLPKFGLDRELDWLKNMEDWLISKERYWGLALPIYECPKCGNFEVIGSKEELKEKAVEGWRAFKGNSPHRPWVDYVKIKCSKCGEVASRISDVGNPWLDAGIVPFSTLKYFEDKNYWQQWFPADFICESFSGQFRNWFYSLIAMSTVLENTPPVKTILGHALVRDEKGEEMHKSKGNAIWFDEAAEKIVVDVMRWMYLTANPYENLNFGYTPAQEIYRRFVLIMRNVYQFFITYANLDNWQPTRTESPNLLDKWLVSKYNQLLLAVTDNLEKYQPQTATTAIQAFVVDDLSTWYLRRSRKRRDKEFYSTIYQVLIGLVKLIAPAIPFMAEDLYQKIKTAGDPESVHLCGWPKAGKIDEDLLQKMARIRGIAEIGHSMRAEKRIRLRQPLQELIVNEDFDDDFQEILKEELNVLEIRLGKDIHLDTKITPALLEQGLVRDLIRLIQELRKKAGLIPADKADLAYEGDAELEKIIEKFKEKIEKNTSTQIKKGRSEVTVQGDYNLAGKALWLGLKK